MHSILREELQTMPLKIVIKGAILVSGDFTYLTVILNSFFDMSFCVNYLWLWHPDCDIVYQ